MTVTGPIDDRAKFNCAQRETKMRQRVYPRWIENGKMTQANADHEIAVMAAIAEDYSQRIRRLEEKGRLI